MKKSLKILAAGLAIIPCALALTACGGGTKHTLVDTNGTYAEASSYDAVETYIADNEATTELDAYRMLIKMDVAMAGATMKMNTDTYINFDGTNLNSYSLFDMKMTVPYMGTENYTFETAIKDNYMYNTNLGEWSYPIELNFSQLQEEMKGTLSLEEVFASIPEVDLDGLTVKSQTTDDTTKFKISLDGAILQTFMAESGVLEDTEDLTEMLDFGMATANIYYVFKDGQFEGAAMDMNLSMNISESGMNFVANCTMTMEFARFDGEIPFPETLPQA